MYQLIITDDPSSVILIDYWRCLDIDGVQYDSAVRTFDDIDSAFKYIKEAEG